jgi:hypothetical protein
MNALLHGTSGSLSTELWELRLNKEAVALRYLKCFVNHRALFCFGDKKMMPMKVHKGEAGYGFVFNLHSKDRRLVLRC